jgi:uncharacterized protein (TIGR03067 family)
MIRPELALTGDTNDHISRALSGGFVMTRLAVIAVLLLPTVSLADDTKAIVGFWKPVSVIADGVERFPEGKAREAITLVVKEGEYRLYHCIDAAKDLHHRLATAEIKLDPTTKGIELTIKDGPQKGQKSHGIYELKDGKFRVCYGPADKPKPTKFDAPAGSGLFCETWTPEKR